MAESHKKAFQSRTKQTEELNRKKGEAFLLYLTY